MPVEYRGMTRYCQREIVLASASPRRREILEAAGFEFVVDPAHGFEEISGNLSPDVLLQHNAEGKAEEIAPKHPESIVLGVDTIGVFGDEILEKPKDRADAKRMLSLLSGQTHEVWTAIQLISPDGNQYHCEKTKVHFHELSEKDIEDYLDTGEYTDKAAAYAIQGGAAKFVKAIEGDYLNVVGFPLQAFWQMIK